MQVAIIGAGIGGLSAYLALHKHLVHERPRQYNVRIFEAYDIRRRQYDAPAAEALHAAKDETLFTPKVIGNAIGLGKNGLAVLRRLDDTGALLQKVQDSGNAISKWRMGTARGWRIVDANVQSSNNEDGKGLVDTVMIARQVAWEVLRDEVLRLDPLAVVKSKVSKVEPLVDGPVRVCFDDGSEITCDLLIGADGLHSVVRQTIFAVHNDYYPQNWTATLLKRQPRKKDYTTPQYEGLTGLGGFVPASVLKNVGYEPGAMSITFGPNGFFGHGYIGPVDRITDDNAPLAAWWSTFSSDNPRPYSKDDSGTLSGMKTSFDRETALKELVHRHSSWTDPAIKQIVSYVEQHKAIEHMYPTYTTPELPTWKADVNIVLLGDAAHAVQPSSGQGACQALEDSEALALLLKHYLHDGKDVGQKQAIGTALNKYVQLRKPRLAKIYTQSQIMSRRKMDLNIVEEWVMYLILWISVKLQTWKKYNDELFEYDLPTEVKKIVRTGP